MEPKEGISTTLFKTSDPYQRNVIVDNKLYKILSDVVSMNPVMTLSDVVDSLKHYICQKQLFDPVEPMKICLKNDELESVFGMTDCVISDIMQAIPKIVHPFTGKNAGPNSFTCMPSAVIGHKRKIESVGELGSASCTAKSSTNIVHETDFIPPKKSKTECIFLAIPPSPSRISTSSSSESIHDYETSVVRDTTDEDSLSENDSFSIIAVEETYHLEYEISSEYSVSEEESGDSDDCITVSNTDALNSMFHFICKSDTDSEYLADQSDDSDDEISEFDQWQCKTCFYNRNSPLSRSCHKCFEIRTGWLPPVWKNNTSCQRRCRAKRKRLLKKEKSPVFGISITKDELLAKSFSLNEVRSNSSKESGSVTDLKYNLAAEKTNFPDCLLCCDQPANGAILHRNSKFAHIICCYNCAINLQNRKQKCPVCRRNIERVVYSVFS